MSSLKKKGSKSLMGLAGLVDDIDIQVYDPPFTLGCQNETLYTVFEKVWTRHHWDGDHHKGPRLNNGN